MDLQSVSFWKLISASASATHSLPFLSYMRRLFHYIWLAILSWVFLMLLLSSYTVKICRGLMELHDIDILVCPSGRCSEIEQRALATTLVHLSWTFSCDGCRCLLIPVNWKIVHMTKNGNDQPGLEHIIFSLRADAFYSFCRDMFNFHWCWSVGYLSAYSGLDKFSHLLCWFLENLLRLTDSR
jgi:hypothetical protein